MKIKYLNCDGKAKLFSFYRHHYNTLDIDNKHYMIDGGMSGNYIRYSSDYGTLEEASVKDVIVDIREVFEWTQNFDENNNRIPSVSKKLKELSSSHICGILAYFTNKLLTPNGNIYTPDLEWLIIHDIFIQELDYRIKYNLI